MEVDCEVRARVLIAAALSMILVGISSVHVAPVSAQSAQSAPITLTLFDDGDVNIQQLWQNVLFPEYEKLHPNIKLNLVFDQHGTDDAAIYARMVASIQAHKADPFDIIDAGFIGEAALARELVPLTPKAVPNLKLVDPPLLRQVLGQAVPYRGSEVVLAYNSQFVKNPPKTLDQLITWIQHNPGKFAYCNPADGGSGDAFVQAVVLRGLSANQVAAFQSATSYRPKLESAWNKNLKFLATLGKDTYRGGYYANGNTQVIQLLAQGAVQMATVWSDMGTAALEQGQLPKTVKLIQLKDPFYGSPAYLAVPKNSAHIAAAEAFMNWVLEPKQQIAIMNSIAGFPGIEWKYLPKAQQAEFASVEAPYKPGMASRYNKDMVDLWQKIVASASANG
jgi:putative spermidine/putrescine transport system substrate-binding protein